MAGPEEETHREEEEVGRRFSPLLASPLLAPKSYTRCKLELGSQDECGKGHTPLSPSLSVCVLWRGDALAGGTAAVVAVAGGRRACNGAGWRLAPSLIRMAARGVCVLRRRVGGRGDKGSEGG